MSRPMGQVIPQPAYGKYLQETAQFIREFKKSIPAEEMAKFEAFKKSPVNFVKGIEESPERWAAAKSLLTNMVQANVDHQLGIRKAGVTTATGYNFYDLRAPVLLSYPVNTPFRNSMQRKGRVNDGYGTAAHWKATRNPGYVYGGVSEGNRNQAGTPDENDYTATYKEIGGERAVTFSAQFGGEGYADNVADEHIRGLQTLMLQEESMILLGNSGTAAGNNGFVLGTCPTPVAALGTGGSIPNNTAMVAFCVAITAMGNPANIQYGYGVFPSVANGLTPSYARTNADGSQNTINGGTSAISAASNSVTALSAGNQQKATFTVAAVKGAFGYAWYVSKNGAPTTANAFLQAVTQFPSFTLLTDPITTSQAANAAGLSTDHSAQALDFDGLLTYAASTTGAGWTDLAGASLTSQKNGRVTDLETILETIWNSYQATVDEIWGSADAIQSVDAGVRLNGTAASAFQFQYARDSQNNLMGGFVVSSYQSRFAMAQNGAQAIPLRIHPMLPPGTLYFHIKNNPYPQSRAEFAAALLVQRDYYSIEWPLVSRQWTFGTYAHEVLAHNFPWIPAVLTGIGPFNYSQ